ncbi:hypothetical protein [Caudoviricetes sp.]|nr:hypothetical protein [Caudoviricetes sp.]
MYIQASPWNSCLRVISRWRWFTQAMLLPTSDCTWQFEVLWNPLGVRK